jgi:dihydroneopterin aldolase/2-amino-4-hydroxy-6-hydroxymethyldihydropteridine diphosphokinase
VAADRIELRGLRLTAAHGVLPEEHGRAQPFELDVDIEADLAVAGRSDALADTVDYGAVVRAISAEMGGVHADLIERLAERVVGVVFAVAGPIATHVTVTVRKLRPPVPVDLATAAVTITRRRPGLEESAAEPTVVEASSLEPIGNIATGEPLLRVLTGEAGRRAFLSLGSNLGDRRQYLADAIAGLPDVVAVSPVYESDPVGGPPDQGRYLNAVVELHTTHGPHALLEAARRAEAGAGRVREEHWGPRTLDVDVLLVGDLTVDDGDELIVPHPRMWERAFVLVPLADLAPEIAEAPLEAIGGRVAAGLRSAGTL